MFTTLSPSSSTGNARKRSRGALAPLSSQRIPLGGIRTSSTLATAEYEEDATATTAADDATIQNHKMQLTAQSKQIHEHSQANARLRSQVTQMSMNERRHKQLLGEVRAQYEATLAHLKSEHESMLERIMSLQEDIVSAKDEVEDMVPANVMESKCNMYEQRIEALEKENNRLKDGLQEQVKITSNAINEAAKTGKISDQVSPAPPDVMRELTRLRVKLADEERLNRMLKRKNDELLPKVQSSALSKELSKRSQEKITKLEQQVRSLQQDNETLKIRETQWSDFQNSVRGLVGMENTSNSSSHDDEGPPEVASIIRRMKSLESSVEIANQHRLDCENVLKSARLEISELKLVQKQHENSQRQLQDLNSLLKKESLDMKDELAKTQTSERITKMEASSLRELLETYENMSSTGFNISPAKSNPTIDGLRVSLKSAQESNAVLKDEVAKANDKIQQMNVEMSKTGDELQRVMEKFSKLRDALMQEKEKVKVAEERAVEAETLAGKGSFNTETTRVLHLQQNPLTQAIHDKYQQDIKKLTAEIKLLKSGGASSSGIGGKVGIGSDVDAQKLHQRLKESFKEQISLFREGVYLLTGYKIDMIAGEQADRPRFKVRSMYAAREDDYLMFMWPDVKRTKTITMLDLLSTDFAQTVTKSEEFAYVTRFNSIPGFLASLTVKLFDEQTCIG